MVIETLKEHEVSDLVINSLPGIFYIQDDEGNCLRWNKNFEKVSGYTANEIRELNAFAFFPEKDHARVMETMTKIFTEGEAEIEVDTITKHKKIIPYYLNGRSVYYEGKHCLLGMGIDITKLINVEHEVKKSESHLRAIFENVDGAACLLDNEKRLVIFNNQFVKAYKKLSGMEPVPGIHIYDFLSAEDLKERNELLDRVLNGSKEAIEVCHERDGERIYYRIVYNPVVTDNAVTGISCYSTDLTGAKKAEQATQKNQERLNYHINNTPLAVIEYDNDLKVTFWSKKATEIFGWDEEDAWGKKITEFLLHKDDTDTVTEHLLLPHTNTLERKPIETRNYAKDGRVLYCRWHNSFLTDEHGNIETIMSIARDITDLKKAELQREEMADDLIKRNNELEQFTYIVSHNLRAPVASLIGLAEVLSEYELSEKDKMEIISGISQSAKRLDGVIRDLNDILHLKTGLNEKKEVVNFTNLLTEIQHNTPQYFNNGDFKIETDFAIVDSYYTIKNYLSSIFSNLIFNSIKYKQPDMAAVIKIKSELKGKLLLLTFNDNGLGFDINKTSGDIFGLYKRFHFHVEGKGLGLFIVKTQVELLGGKIMVDSEVNKGTEFRIEFEV